MVNKMNNEIPIKVMQIAMALVLSLGLAACNHNRLKPKTVRICDPSGCTDRPSDYASYDPSAANPQDELDKNIPALEEIARKDPRAAYDLGLRFFRGDGVRQDSYKALQWMRDAGERGNLDAQKALGRFYLTGLEEMGSDPGEAQRWLSMAASRGDKESAELLKEANEAKRNETYYEWSDYWRPVFYNYWYSGYPYRYYWRSHRWYYYP